MQALQRLLLDRLHANRIDVGRTGRFEQRTGIGRVGLVAADVGANIVSAPRTPSLRSPG
jgi:hypothetical protein